MSAGSAVTIAGRVFELGAVYAPRAQGKPHRPRRRVGYDPTHPWPGGRVEVEIVPSEARSLRLQSRWLSGKAWARWAGEKVGPDE